MNWQRAPYWGLSLYLLIVIVFFFACIKPEADTLSLLREKAQKIQSKASQLENTAGENWKERKEEILHTTSSFQQTKEKDEQYFVSRIMEYCQKAGVTLNPISPLPATKKEKDFLKWIWKIDVEGSYHDLGILFNQIEKSLLFFAIEDCAIYAKRTEKTRAEFSLATYFLIEKKEEENEEEDKKEKKKKK